MSEEEIRELIELAVLSPTSFNIQNWRFVVVTDPSIRKVLRAAAWNQAQVTDASILIILCADLNAATDRTERYYSNVPEPVRDKLVPMIKGLYAGKEQLARDEAMRSCGIAGQTIMLAAKAMGYDTCAMVGLDMEKVARIINLPEGYCISFVVTVGKALQPARPRSGQLPVEEVMVFDAFNG
jgi:nitroreductase